MIKAHTHPLSYLCTATFILFLLPQSIHAQTDMTREERIKILEALKESDAILEKSISGSQLPETQHYIEGFDLPPLSVFMDAVIENATVKRAHSQVEQVKNQYRIEKKKLVELLPAERKLCIRALQRIERQQRFLQRLVSVHHSQFPVHLQRRSQLQCRSRRFIQPSAPAEELSLQHRAASIHAGRSNGRTAAQSAGSI